MNDMADNNLPVTINNKEFTDNFCPCQKEYYDRMLDFSSHRQKNLTEFEFKCGTPCARALELLSDRLKLEVGIAHGNQKRDLDPEHLLLLVESMSFATNNYRRWKIFGTPKLPYGD